MYTFLISLIVLLAGFLTYGRLTEMVFGPDDRQTPAYAINDGVDCVPIKTWKALLIQLLNIAGTGPIFGALMGVCFGLSASAAYPAGIVIALFTFTVYITELQQWRIAPEELRENWRYVGMRRRTGERNEQH